MWGVVYGIEGEKINGYGRWRDRTVGKAMVDFEVEMEIPAKDTSAPRIWLSTTAYEWAFG